MSSQDGIGHRSYCSVHVHTVAKLISGVSGMGSTFFVLLILTKVFSSCVLGETFMRRPIFLVTLALINWKRSGLSAGCRTSKTGPVMTHSPDVKARYTFGLRSVASRPPIIRTCTIPNLWQLHLRAENILRVSERKRAYCRKIAHFEFEGANKSIAAA